MTAIPALSRLRRASDHEVLAERLEPPYTPLRWQDAPLEPTAIYAEIIDTDGGVWRSPEYTAEDRRPPLDPYSADLAAAYSLRRLLTSYTGPAIRVRRSSDNAETDIGFTAGGDLDTATLATFVGGGSGYVTRWYDQSPNARHAIQATASRQPTIVTAGAVEALATPRQRAAIWSDATYMHIPTFSVTDLTIVHVLHQPGHTRQIHYLVCGADQGTWVNGSARPDQWGILGGGSRRYGAGAPTVPAVLTASNDRLWHDGAEPLYTESETVPGLDIDIIGTRSDQTNLSFRGHLAEIIIYAAITPHRDQVEANALHYYGIAP